MAAGMTTESRRSLRVFYRDYVNAVSIPSSQPEALAVERIAALAGRLWDNSDNFVGVVDRNDVILQGYRDDDASVVLEMIYPEATGCLRLRLPGDDALALMAELPDVFDASLLRGARYIG
jgi:hypothetical protein